MNKESEYSHIIQLSQQVPLVFFDLTINNCPVRRVTSEDYNSAYEAAQYLLEGGFEKIYFIGINESVSVIIYRLNGLKKSLVDRQVDLATVEILFLKNSGETYYRLKECLSRRQGQFAFFSSVERYALQLCKLCSELNIKIARDVKIISFSNNPYSGLFMAPLSVVEPPVFKIGKISAEILLELIDNIFLSKKS